MHSTPLIAKALNVAAKLHDGQYRKGKSKLPYITHPMTVAMIVSKYTDDEEIIASALLHDTIEDTEYAEDELRRDFGNRVCGIVMGVTSPEAMSGTRAEHWHRYVLVLRKGPPESAMVAAADKIHNFRSTLETYGNDASAFVQDFRGSPEERIAAYEEIVSVLTEKLSGDSILDELQLAWQEYRAFIESVKIRLHHHDAKPTGV